MLPDKTGNSGELNVRLPALRVVHPSEVDGYLIVARDLLQGVQVLATLPSVSPRAAALIAGHTLECVLKAFILHKGVDASRDRNTWHNLLALWSMACKKGLDISQAAPDWVTILSSGHDRPFYFRYQEGEGGTVANGGQTPALLPMAAALKTLLETVELAVKGGGDSK